MTVTDNNTYKTVKEAYLIEADSFTEAETVMCKYAEKEYPNQDFQISRISPTKIASTYITKESEGTTDPWWKCKIELIEMRDGKNGELKPKKVPFIILIQAQSSDDVPPFATKIGKSSALTILKSFELKRQKSLTLFFDLLSSRKLNQRRNNIQAGKPAFCLQLWRRNQSHQKER